MVVAAVTGLAATTYSVLRYRQARREVSGHAELDRALTETTERYHALFHDHPDGVFSLSLDGRFTSANEAAERLSGYSEDELRGIPFTDLLPPDQVAPVTRNFDDVVARRPRHVQARIRQRSGRLVDLSLTGLPIIVGHEVVGIFGIAEDITERLRMQRELERARAAAEDANHAKSLFLATMSHEVRTPLAGVIGAAEMLEDTELDPGQRRLTAVLHRSGVRLLRLVDDILDFSRIEAGGLELEPVEFAVADLLDETLATARSAGTARGLLVEAAYGDLVARAVGDPGRIGQVLANLLDNAVKFTEAGEIRLAARTTPTADGLVLEVEVCDSGIGMSAEQVREVFDPFRQGDSSITRRYGGTGLGLAICRQLVDLMGGTLLVESEVGRGTTFALRLPLGAVG
nr:ATP-binding protein [Nocardioides sp. MAH-18]